jgi:hypothetical protein
MCRALHSDAVGEQVVEGVEVGLPTQPLEGLEGVRTSVVTGPAALPRRDGQWMRAASAARI